MNPARLTIAELVELLIKAGGKHTDTEVIESHLAAGAPRNADGTMHLMHYAAWLAQRVQ